MPSVNVEAFNWADDFDVLEFAHFSNSVRPLIDIDQLAQRLQQSNNLTAEEYEWKKACWRKESANDRRDDSHIPEVLPESKRVRVSSPLAPTNKSLYAEIPRYCTKTHRFVKRSDLRPIVISGPSGSGKSSLIKKLFAEFPGCFGFSISHTTRLHRPGEQDGREYHFTNREKFEEFVRRGDFFLEHTEFSGNLYGTSFDAINALKKDGKVCILDIELNGVRAVKKSGIDARYVYIAPPSLEELRKRLELRMTETPESLEKRLKMAERETSAARNEPDLHDVIIVNDDLEKAYLEFKSYIVENKKP